jgi:hypothetical protein
MRNLWVDLCGADLVAQRDRSRDIGSQIALASEAPTTDAFTVYDEAHFAVYLSLLHASAEGADDAAMCREILGIDPEVDPHRAKAMLKSHLERARWLSAEGRQRVLGT